MKYIKLFKIYIVLILVGIVVSSCDSWFDFTSEKWDLEPQYVSNESIDFGEESNTQTLYISNNGGHSQITFNITSSDKWIVPSATSGTINKNEDFSVKVNVNRTYLPEGNNTGSLSITIDGSLWIIPVTAIGINIIEISPQYLNFGSNDDNLSFIIRSLSGSRHIEISPSSEWLLVSEKDFTLQEYRENDLETEKTISVTCKRGLLDKGDHTSSLEITSGLGANLMSIPVSVTIPSQDSQTIAIDNCVFSISKHLYWEEDKVVLELGIKNHKYLRTFELVGSESYAVADNNKYPIQSTSLSLPANYEKEMKIYILNVDRSINSFTKIVLTIRDLSDKIIFQNVELQ